MPCPAFLAEAGVRGAVKSDSRANPETTAEKNIAKVVSITFHYDLTVRAQI